MTSAASLTELRGKCYQQSKRPYPQTRAHPSLWLDIPSVQRLRYLTRCFYRSISIPQPFPSEQYYTAFRVSATKSSPTTWMRPTRSSSISPTKRTQYPPYQEGSSALYTLAGNCISKTMMSGHRVQVRITFVLCIQILIVGETCRAGQ